MWLSGRVTFEQAEEVLGQVGQVPLLDNTAWRQVKTYSAQAQVVEAAQRAAAMAVLVTIFLTHSSGQNTLKVCQVYSHH